MKRGNTMAKTSKQRKITFVNVTSHKGGAGKSTISLLLAAEIARTSEPTESCFSKAPPTRRITALAPNPPYPTPAFHSAIIKNKQRRVFILDLDFTGTSLTDFSKMPKPSYSRKYEKSPLFSEEVTITHQWIFGEKLWDLTNLITTPFSSNWKFQESDFSKYLLTYEAEEKYASPEKTIKCMFSIIPSSVDPKTIEDILLAEPFANIIKSKVFLLIKLLVSKYPKDDLYFLFDHSPGLFPLAKTFLSETEQIVDFLEIKRNGTKPEVKDVFVFTPDLQDIIETYRLIKYFQDNETKKNAAANLPRKIFTLQNLGVDLKKNLDDTVKKNILRLLDRVDEKIAPPPGISFSCVPRSDELRLFSIWNTLSGKNPDLEPFPAIPPGIPGIVALAKFVTKAI